MSHKQEHKDILDRLEVLEKDVGVGLQFLGLRGKLSHMQDEINRLEGQQTAILDRTYDELVFEEAKWVVKPKELNGEK